MCVGCRTRTCGRPWFVFVAFGAKVKLGRNVKRGFGPRACGSNSQPKHRTRAARSAQRSDVPRGTQHGAWHAIAMWRVTRNAACSSNMQRDARGTGHAPWPGGVRRPVVSPTWRMTHTRQRARLEIMLPPRRHAYAPAPPVPRGRALSAGRAVDHPGPTCPSPRAGQRTVTLHLSPTACQPECSEPHQAEAHVRQRARGS